MNASPNNSAQTHTTPNLAPDVFRYSGQRISIVRLSTIHTLFHGTTSSRLESINQNGLQPIWDPNLKSYPQVDEIGVYLGITHWRVLQYAQRAAQRFGGEPIILAIDIRQLDQTAFEADRDYFRQYRQFHKRFCQGSITGSQHIHCSNAELSLTMTGSLVYHNATVAPSAIRIANDIGSDETLQAPQGQLRAGGGDRSPSNPALSIQKSRTDTP